MTLDLTPEEVVYLRDALCQRSIDLPLNKWQRERPMLSTLFAILDRQIDQHLKDQDLVMVMEDTINDCPF